MKIKTHRLNQEYAENYFFILSKGNNTGKPLVKPCPNCFVLMADNAEERESLYWLCYGLWQGGCFRPFLSGSVIPFIHLDDLKKVIREAYVKVKLNPKAFTEAVEMLNRLTAHQEKIIEQLSLIAQAKKALMYKALKEKRPPDRRPPSFKKSEVSF